MPRLLCKAFVLRSVRYGENRRMLDLLGENDRLISISAAAGRGRSGAAALSQAFVFGEFELFETQGRFRFNQGELLHAFLPLSEDFRRLSAAAHLAELFCDALRSGQTVAGAYELWAYASQRLSQSSEPLFDVRIAQYRFLCLLGFSPWLRDCSICHAAFEPGFVFQTHTGGLICPRHPLEADSGGRLRMSSGLRACLLYLADCRVEQLFAFKAEESLKKEVIAFSDCWCEEVMEKKYERLKIAEDLENFSFQTEVEIRESERESEKGMKEHEI